MDEVRDPRMSSPMTVIIAPLTSYILWATSTGKKAVLKKIRWNNRSGGAGMLRVGYLTLAAAFVQVLPDIYMVSGVDDSIGETDLPICGNDMAGFCANATPVLGTLGFIIVQATVGGASPADVQVIGEVAES